MLISIASIGESSNRRASSRVLLDGGPRQVGEEPRLGEVERGQDLVDDRPRAGVLQPDRIEHPPRRLPHPVGRIAEPRLERRPLQADRAGVPVREALDPRILLAEPHAAREQHQRGVERQAAELDREPPPVIRVQGHVPRRPVSAGDPPNTGNIIRLCANTGCALHLVKPLGFRLDEPRLRRAGLDYHEWTTVREHASLDAFDTVHSPRRDVRLLGPGRDAPLRRLVPGGRRAAVRPGDERAPGCGPWHATRPSTGCGSRCARRAAA